MKSQLSVIRACAGLACVMFMFLGSVSRAASTKSPHVELTKKPPSRVKLLTPVKISWRVSNESENLQCRHKLDVPGDIVGGLRYASNKWEKSQGSGSVRYGEFTRAGTYRFTVECAERRLSLRKTRDSVRWNVYLEYPEVLTEALRIDVARARAARTPRQRCTILAEEFRRAHQMWNRQWAYASRQLKLTTSPDELVAKAMLMGYEKAAGSVIEESLEVAGQHVAAKLASRAFMGKLLHDLAKEGLTDVVLIYRNHKANKAFTMSLITFQAWKHFEKKARRV